MLGSLTGCSLLLAPDPTLIHESTLGEGGTGAAAPGCQADTQCNDGAPCTYDRCVSEACTFTPTEVGVSCDDGDPCNGFETCDGLGVCAAHPLAEAGVCSVRVCDPVEGRVTYTAAPGCIAWAPLPMEGAPSPRFGHTAVWTGSRMIVWGGEGHEKPAVTATGALFDPALGTWKATSMNGAPEARSGHAAVWTGSKMLVWGGYGASDYAKTGAAYDPETDTWTPLASLGAPSPRAGQGFAWAGGRLVVWGGVDTGPRNDGGLYDPEADTWTATSLVGAPAPRFGHTLVGADGRAFVWGGQNLFDWKSDGAWLDVMAAPGGAWSATPMANAPSARQDATAVFTGTSVLAWGGWSGGPNVDSGASLGLGDAAWNTMSQQGAAPARSQHVAVWTGSALVVWGGCADDACKDLLADGGRFVPGAGAGFWSTPIPAVSTLSARRGATAVFTGSEILIFGGRDATGALGTGARGAP